MGEHFANFRFILKHISLIFVFCVGFTAVASPPKVFRLHLPTEPKSLDFTKQRGLNNSSSLHNNLHRSLYRLNAKGQAEPDLAENCSLQKSTKHKSILWKCTLRKNLKWSDGSPIIAADFLRSFLHLLNPKDPSARADLLFGIKGAKAYFQNQGSEKDLGIRIKGKDVIEFELTEADKDFEFRLSSELLAPIKLLPFPSPELGEKLVASGPYKIKTWQTKTKLILTPNTFDQQFSDSRPEVEVLFIADESTAFNLFQKNKLDLLRRLPTSQIPHYQTRPEFREAPLVRLDYVGFGPELDDKAWLREALSLSLNYDELQKFLNSKGRYGCPGLPDSLLQERPCLPYDLARAKKMLKQEELKNIKLKFMYSALGGEDHRKVAEWMQTQWQKHLGIHVEVRSLENKIFSETLKAKPPMIFRRGVSPDLPTCLSALENFLPRESNTLKVNSSKFLQAFDKVKLSENELSLKKACSEANQVLLEEFRIIPTGFYNISYLQNPAYEGISVNPLNQLDLSHLHLK